MRFLFIPFGLLLALTRVDAQIANDFPAAHGRSGQFIVRAVAQRPARSAAHAWESMKVPVTQQGWGFLLNPGTGPRASDATQVEMEPASLAVSCERFKETLLFELGMSDQWRGKIFLLINSSLPEDTEPALTAVLNRDGWSYHLDFPSRLKSTQLLRALTHVLLLEIANRNAGKEATQIPLWLVEGMMAHLQANNLPTFIVQPKVRTLGNKIELVGMDHVRAALHDRTPLTFQDLSWPEPEKLTGDELKFYQACAQLFVYELLRLKDGRVCLRQMMQDLPQFLNWQLAFLKAFHSHFEKLLDVEKWWGLSCVSFMGHDAAQVWSRDESWRKLQEALDVPVQIYLETNRLPAAAAITLQEVVMQWEAAQELPALQKVVNQLLALRLRLAPELASLADRYRGTLENYLRDRQAPRRTVGKMPVTSLAVLKKSVSKELTALDEQRAALRGKMVSNRREAEFRALEMVKEKR